MVPGWMVHVAPAGQVPALDELDLVTPEVGPCALVADRRLDHAGPVVPPDQDGVAGRRVVHRAREGARGDGSVEQPAYDVWADVGEVDQGDQCSRRPSVSDWRPVRREAPIPSSQSAATTTSTS